MSIKFASASSQAMPAVVANLLTGIPLTLFCISKKASDDNLVPFSLSVLDGTDTYARLYWTSTAISYRISGSTAMASSESVGSRGTGVWYRTAGVSRSQTAHELWIDGVNEGTSSTDTGALSGANINRVCLGTLAAFSSYLNPFDGLVAECAIWNVDLTPSELKDLTVGRRAPDEIRPNNLVFYTDAKKPGVRDQVLGTGFTVINGPLSQDEHPQVRRRLRRSAPKNTVAAGGGSIRVKMHHYKQMMGAN